MAAPNPAPQGDLTFTADEALWRAGNRWVVEGNLADSNGTPDVGAFVIAYLKKENGTQIEIGSSTVDILPAPGFDILNRPIANPALDDVDEVNDVVVVYAISSDGTQKFAQEVQVNAPPEPLVHNGTEIQLEDVEILTDNRLIIHGQASVDDAPATGDVTLTTDQSNQTFVATLETVGPLAGGFDFVVRPLVGNGGFIDGEVMTASHPEAGTATFTIDLTPEAPHVPAEASAELQEALRQAISSGVIQVASSAQAGQNNQDAASTNGADSGEIQVTSSTQAGQTSQDTSSMSETDGLVEETDGTVSILIDRVADLQAGTGVNQSIYPLTAEFLSPDGYLMGWSAVTNVSDQADGRLKVTLTKPDSLQGVDVGSISFWRMQSTTGFSNVKLAEVAI